MVNLTRDRGGCTWIIRDLTDPPLLDLNCWTSRQPALSPRSLRIIVIVWSLLSTKGQVQFKVTGGLDVGILYFILYIGSGVYTLMYIYI